MNWKTVFLLVGFEVLTAARMKAIIALIDGGSKYL
jgi:hypothetical protein